MNVAIIPARGGSKRIPHKNIKEFCGKPMIAWSIEAAIRSDCFEHIIVSTDDNEVAEVSRQFGAEIPFMRPPHLADDHTPTRPVINHAISELREIYGLPKYVCCILATAPFLQEIDIKKGLDLIKANECKFVFSVTSFPYPIQRAIRLTNDGRVEMFNPEYVATRSQDLEEAYHDAGQFYWGQTQAFLDDISTFSVASIPIVLPRYRVQDVDTLEDWIRAEWLFKTNIRNMDVT
jgi:N-acylneuraminate cytidylyltransferase